MRKVLFLLALTGIGAWTWYQAALRPVDAARDALLTVNIPKGTSVRGIAELLEGQGIVRSAFAFRLRSRARELQDRLQAGSFVLSPAMGTDDILGVLSGARAMQLTVTIPEGFTVRDIDALIARKGLAATGAILTCAQECNFSTFDFLPKLLKRPALSEAPGSRIEGYLFPDTYFVAAADFDAKAFLWRLLRTFQERVVDASRDELRATKHSWHEIVTMASLIEEETRTDEERPLVAGILWKRFDAHLGLDVDAALRYALNKATGTITKDDLQLNSLYNLRRYRGLPPSPIANPGLESIKAAIHPKASPYWYYLHDSDGQIRYAITNEGHNENRVRYLR